MMSLQALFGKDDAFYNLLEASAAEGAASAHNLSRLLRDKAQRPALEEFIQSRRKDKQITKEISERLVKTLVTALEREDIESLSAALYKIPKSIEKFAERYLMMGSLVGDVDFTRQVGMLEQATAHVTEMVKALRKSAHLEQVKETNGRLQQVEGDADKLMLELLKDLYSGRHEPMKVLALKELYEILEKVVDRCRDAGNVVTYIVLKHS